MGTSGTKEEKGGGSGKEFMRLAQHLDLQHRVHERSDLLGHGHTSQLHPSEHEEDGASHHGDSGEDLQTPKLAVLAVEQRSGDRRATECRNTDHGEQRALSDSDLGNVRGDLSDEGGDHGHESSRRESIQRGEDDVHRCRRG